MPSSNVSIKLRSLLAQQAFHKNKAKLLGTQIKAYMKLKEKEDRDKARAQHVAVVAAPVAKAKVVKVAVKVVAAAVPKAKVAAAVLAKPGSRLPPPNPKVTCWQCDWQARHKAVGLVAKGGKEHVCGKKLYER